MKTESKRKQNNMADTVVSDDTYTREIDADIETDKKTEKSQKGSKTDRTIRAHYLYIPNGADIGEEEASGKLYVFRKRDIAKHVLANAKRKGIEAVLLKDVTDK